MTRKRTISPPSLTETAQMMTQGTHTMTQSTQKIRLARSCVALPRLRFLVRLRLLSLTAPLVLLAALLPRILACFRSPNPVEYAYPRLPTSITLLQFVRAWRRCQLTRMTTAALSWCKLQGPLRPSRMPSRRRRSSGLLILSNRWTRLIWRITVLFLLGILFLDYCALSFVFVFVIVLTQKDFVPLHWRLNWNKVKTIPRPMWSQSWMHQVPCSKLSLYRRF